jgi:hypothetical protein
MLDGNEDYIQITTIERHILEEQSSHPEATGVLTSLFTILPWRGK